MSSKESVYTKNQVKDLAEKLNSEVDKFRKSLNKLEKDINLLQEGDGTKPYWNGENAYNWTMSCLAHIDHDKELLKHLEKCSDYLNLSAHSDSSL